MIDVAGRVTAGLRRERPVNSANRIGPATGSSRYRFTRENRLLDAAAFARVFKAPVRSRDACFTVLARPSGLAPPRLGLAIAKKHCRKATARNRIRRIVRESFRHHPQLLAGLDVVVMNQPGAMTATNEQLFASLSGHWERVSAAASETAAGTTRRASSVRNKESGRDKQQGRRDG